VLFFILNSIWHSETTSEYDKIKLEEVTRVFVTMYFGVKDTNLQRSYDVSYIHLRPMQLRPAGFVFRGK
jgi:hypothetical protein